MVFDRVICATTLEMRGIRKKAEKQQEINVNAGQKA